MIGEITGVIQIKKESSEYSFPFLPIPKYINLEINMTKKGNILRFLKMHEQGNLTLIYYPYKDYYKILLFNLEPIKKDD